MAFSSFGDWLGLLASTALAQQLAGGDYAKANFAIAGVFIVRLLPAVILGPFAGVIADKFDRRKLMIVCDVLRFSLYLSMPSLLLKMIPCRTCIRYLINFIYPSITVANITHPPIYLLYSGCFL
jgi:MFS family permease